MERNKQAGSAVVISIVIAGVLIIGGVVTYALTGGSNGNDENEASTEAVNDSTQDDNTTDEKALPADFPDSVPIYEPSSITTINTSGSNYVVGLRTESGEDEVVVFYETELNSNDWSMLMSGDDGRFTAANGGMNIVVDVTEAGDGAIFTITAPKQ